VANPFPPLVSTSPQNGAIIGLAYAPFIELGVNDPLVLEKEMLPLLLI
jgi:hypothetical protein